MHSIEFSRQPCPNDPSFVVIRLRMPMASVGKFTGSFTGNRAKYKATQFIFSTTAGVFAACGMFPLATALNGAARPILEALLNDCDGNIPVAESERLGSH